MNLTKFMNWREIIDWYYSLETTISQKIPLKRNQPLTDSLSTKYYMRAKRLKSDERTWIKCEHLKRAKYSLIISIRIMIWEIFRYFKIRRLPKLAVKWTWYFHDLKGNNRLILLNGNYYKLEDSFKKNHL